MVMVSDERADDKFATKKRGAARGVWNVRENYDWCTRSCGHVHIAGKRRTREEEYENSVETHGAGGRSGGGVEAFSKTGTLFITAKKYTNTSYTRRNTFGEFRYCRPAHTRRLWKSLCPARSDRSVHHRVTAVRDFIYKTYIIYVCNVIITDGRHLWSPLRWILNWARRYTEWEGFADWTRIKSAIWVRFGRDLRVFTAVVTAKILIVGPAYWYIPIS